MRVSAVGVFFFFLGNWEWIIYYWTFEKKVYFIDDMPHALNLANNIYTARHEE